MSGLIRSIDLPRVGVLALVAVVLGACDTPPNTVTDLTENQPVLKVVMATSAEGGFPSGSATLSETVISGFDFSVPDGFARATDLYNYDEGCPCWFYDPPDIGDADSPDDRSPAPTASGVTYGAYAGGEFLAVPPAGNTVADTYNWYGSFLSESFAEGQQVWVGLARLGVSLSGELDQNEILVGRSVGSPDALVYVDESPGGDGGRRADEFNDGRSGRPPPFPAEPDANPWVMGYGEAIGGELVVDFVFSSQDASDNVVYHTTASGFDPVLSPVAGNGAGSFGDIQYNYMLFWDDNPLTNANANVLFRIQLGADAQATSLTPQNNGYAPFPREVADDPASLPGGAESFPAPGKVELDLTGLASVGMNYALWTYDRSSGAYSLAEGSDITIDDQAPVVGASFASPGTDAQIHIDVTPGADFAASTHLVLSMESAAGGSPSETRFLYKEYLTSAKALSDGAMTFGGFNGGTGDYQFVNGGSGTGEFVIIGGERRLVAQLRRIPQAAQGFHYQSYIVELLPSTPVSQYQRVNAVQLDALGNGRDVIQEAQVSPTFASYNTYVLLLEPDGTEALTNYYVQQSDNYQFKFVDFFPR